MTEIVYNKNGVPFDIDAIATDINGKMDKDGLNATCPMIVSRTPNNQGGITEIWSDGYCIQTGKLNTTSSATVTFAQSYIDTNYNPRLTVGEATAVDVWGDKPTVITSSLTTQSMDIYLNPRSNGYPTRTVYWKVEGYIR